MGMMPAPGIAGARCDPDRPDIGDIGRSHRRLIHCATRKSGDGHGAKRQSH